MQFERATLIQQSTETEPGAGRDGAEHAAVARRLEALNAAAIAISSELELERLLELIAATARDLLGARYAAIGVPGADGTLARFVTVGLEPDQVAAIGAPPVGRGLLGVLLREQKVLRLERMAADPRAAGFPPGHPAMTSLLGVPVVFRGRTVGDLYLCDKRDGEPFDSEDERTVIMLAAHAGIAIANATSLGAVHDELQRRLDELELKNHELQRLSTGILAAQEDERLRLARELHDDTMQSLAALSVQARLLERRANPDELRAGLVQLRDGLGRALADLRRLTYDLRPSALDELGLGAALRGLARDVSERWALPVQVRIETPAQRLPSSTEVVLYRVAQEALSNVARHAGASQARLQLTLDGGVRLVVSDDGHGFDPDSRRTSRESGLGLLGMEERVEALQGTLKITSGPSEGTTVEAHLPRPRPAGAGNREDDDGR